MERYRVSRPPKKNEKGLYIFQKTILPLDGEKEPITVLVRVLRILLDRLLHQRAYE